MGVRVPRIIFIHGTGASWRSFSYLRDRMPPHEATYISYIPDDKLESVIQNTKDLLNTITDKDDPITIVGHSLGGVIGYAAHHHPAVAKLVTLSAPFGGCAAADFFRWVSPSPMFDNIRPNGKILRTVRSVPLKVPMLAIVTTSGLPLDKEPNDGVVTVSSQTAIPGPQYHRVHLNHSEALMDDDTIETINKFVFE